MSNDQIIRSTKPHEVTIPEGSNNARSIRNQVGQRDIEQDHEDAVTADRHDTDRTVQVESDAIVDQQVEVEPGADAGAHVVALPQQENGDAARLMVSAAQAAAEHRIALDASTEASHRVMVDAPADETPHRVTLPTAGLEDARAMLPHQEGRTDNRVPIAHDNPADNRAYLPEDSRADHRVTLPSEGSGDHRAGFEGDASSGSHATVDASGLAAHRARLPDDEIDSHSHVQEGDTASDPVTIPSDSLQDSFATTPLMTHTDSPPVKVDGHGITDPDRVIVESSPDPLGDVLVPHAQAEASASQPAHEEALQAVTQDPPAPAVPALAHMTTAQVTAHLVDKKAEEFRGRVVKLRDEVDQLNRRLDEFKK